MIRIKISGGRRGGLSSAAAFVREHSNIGDANLGPIYEEISAALKAGRVRMALNGTDVDGDRHEAIARSGWRWREKYGKGVGQPLAPDGEASHFVTSFYVERAGAGKGKLAIKVGYRGTMVDGKSVAAVISGHAEGIRRRDKTVVRDTVGFDKKTIDEIDEILLGFAVSDLVPNPENYMSTDAGVKPKSRGVVGRTVDFIKRFFGR